MIKSIEAVREGPSDAPSTKPKSTEIVLPPDVRPELTDLKKEVGKAATAESTATTEVRDDLKGKLATGETAPGTKKSEGLFMGVRKPIGEFFMNIALSGAKNKGILHTLGIDKAAYFMGLLFLGNEEGKKYVA